MQGIVIANGTQISGEEIFAQYANMVYRLALVNTSNHADAEDAFQEVFVKLIQNQKKIVSQEHLKAWLIRVTVNQCRTQFAAIHRHAVVPLSTIAEMRDAQTETALEQVGRGELLFQAVQKLPEKQREVIYLFYYEEQPIKEISMVLGRSQGVIKAQLSRARKKLKEILAERGIYDENF